MTETDKVIQIAANRIQGLTAKVNHWKQRASELEAALGSEKAARIEAEATLSRTLNSWVGQIANPDRDTLAAQVRSLEDIIDGIRNSLKLDDGDDVLQSVKNHVRFSVEESAYWRWLQQEAMGALAQEREHREKERDGLTAQAQDMRNEIARLRVDLRAMSERSNGSEWEQKAAELEELRTELNLVKQERDCAKSEWDRTEGRCKTLGGEVADLFSDRQRLKAEPAVVKDERDELRAKVGKSLSWKCTQCKQRISGHESLDMKLCPQCGHKLEAVPCEPSAPTPRSHPVKVGEWVKLAGKKSKVVSVGAAGYSLDGQRHCLFSDCTPCDPPEATEQMMLRRERVFAVKEAETNVLEDPDRDVRKIQRKPKPGDVVRLVLIPTQEEYEDWDEDYGIVGSEGVVKDVGPRFAKVHFSGFTWEWPLSCIEIVDAK